jgi:hypothetical protein
MELTMEDNCDLIKIIVLAIVLFLLLSVFGQIVFGEEKLDDNNIGITGILAFYPESHHFGNKLVGETNSTIFEIWRAGGCCALEYTLSWHCSWVNVFPTSGTSHGERDTITVDIDTTGLDLGFHTCNIMIESTEGNGVFKVIVNIVQDTDPINLRYYPESYFFGNKLIGKTDSTTLEIWHSGYGALSYSTIWDCDWINVIPTSGISYGEPDTITVNMDTTVLDIGLQTCEILIESNGGNGVFVAQVNVIDPNPYLSYNPQSHDFGNKFEGETDSVTFEIWNSGYDILTYSLIWDCDWVNISPTTGSSYGERDTITASIDTTGLATGNYYCNISINSDGGNGIFTVTTNITELPKNPPTPPDINGPSSGIILLPNNYTFVSSDPDGDDISYFIEWGDGDTTSWTAFQPGSLGYSESHTWLKKDTYIIRAKAKDSDGLESDWAELPISMSRNKPYIDYPLLQFLQKFFEKYPNALPLLQKLLNF